MERLTYGHPLKTTKLQVTAVAFGGFQRREAGSLGRQAPEGGKLLIDASF